MHTKIRPLGYNEKYQLARYALDQYRGTSVLCRYKIPRDLTASDIVDIVNGAIGNVILASPALQVGVAGEDSKKPYFIELGNVDLSKHVKWITLKDSVDIDEQIQAAVASRLDMRFFDFDARPGWRVLVMQHAQANVLDILFVWNHLHCDGMGGKIFHQLLLKTLQQGPKTRPDHDVNDLSLKVPDTSKTFPPPTETLVKLSLAPKYLLREAWDEHKPPALFPPKETAAKWAPIRTLPYQTRFRVLTLPNDILSNVLSTCRKRNTTLTALLHSLALLSLSSRIDAKAAPAFASGTAIDQRRFLPTRPEKFPWLDPRTTIANYVTNMMHEHNTSLVAQVRAAHATGSSLSVESEDLLWSTATRVRNEIQTRLDSGVHNDRVGLSRFVPSFKKMFESDMKKPRKLSWVVTNLGVFDGEGEGGWLIQRAQFTLSTEIPVAALQFAVASVRGGEMIITCTWQDCVVEEGLVGGVIGDLERWLREIAEE